jgi:hypothetical protein
MKQCLNFSKVLILDREIDREPIPQIPMLVFHVSFEPTTKACRQSNVVEFVFSIERVNARISADEIPHHVWMSLACPRFR